MLRSSSVSTRSLVRPDKPGQAESKIGTCMTTYEFQIMLLSLIPTLANFLYIARIFSTPSSNVCCVLKRTETASLSVACVREKRRERAHLKTAASDCIAFCISSLILAVGSGPFAFLGGAQSVWAICCRSEATHLILSRNSMLCLPASSGICR
jgi:hypothetical protein